MTLAIAVLLLAGVSIEVETLEPPRHVGRLSKITATDVVIEKDAGPEVIPRGKILALQATGVTPPDVGPITVHLHDGGQLAGKMLSTAGKQAKVRLTNDQDLDLPLAAIAAITFRPLTGVEAEDFAKQLRQKRAADLLAIDRNGMITVLEGILGELGEQSLQFTYDGQDLPVKRERLFAMFYRSSESMPGAGVAEVRDRWGNRWLAQTLAWENDALVFTTAGGLDRALPAGDLQRVDFGRSKVKHLSDIEPLLVRHTPFFDVPFPVRKDANEKGAPISIAGVKHAKGLVLHSRTEIEWELAGQQQSLETLVGVEDSAGPLGDAVVRIVVDGKTVWEKRVQAKQPAEKLNLPLTGAKRLRFEVDFGERLDLGDHIAFADAKLIQ